MTNKYLKIINQRLNKRFVNLNTSYFHLNENLMKAKTLKTDELSKAFLKLSRDLEKFITIDSIHDYVKTVSPIINYQKLSSVLKNNKNIGIIVFDTETTGLVKRTSFDTKKNKKIIRNQIYELAAITYDYSLEEAKENNKVDYFHAKVKDAALNAQNSVQKIGDKIKKILSSDLDMDSLEKAYIMATEKNKFNPDYKIFEANLPNKYKSVASLLIKMMPISKLRKMTKADKEQFADLWTGEKYMVNFYDSEMAMIHKFFNYIEKQKAKFDEVYILAHNLSYDRDMIFGAIEDSISYWQTVDGYKPEVKNKMLADAQLLDVKAKSFFSQSIDTLDGFKTLINEKKYIDKIELLAKKLKIYKNKKNIPAGEKGFISKLIFRMTKLSRTKDIRFRSTSLGKLAPKSINRDWHTALNDVFVTMKTTKMYFTIPIIISLLIKISENYHKNKNIVNFPNIKIPISLIKFAIRNDFANIYEKVKQEVPETYNNPFFAKNTTREVVPTDKERVINLNPDFFGSDDVKITKNETGKDGLNLIQDLQIEKDFNVKSEIKKAIKEKKMSQLTKEINKLGVNISQKELENIDKNGLPNYMDVYDTLKAKGFNVGEEYEKAKKIKQGSKYIVDRIKKKYKLDIDKNQIISILKHLGLKK